MFCCLVYDKPQGLVLNVNNQKGVANTKAIKAGGLIGNIYLITREMVSGLKEYLTLTSVFHS